MFAPAVRRLAARTIPLGIALALLAALPGVAVASLPAHPAPTHDCCAADAPPMDAGCGEAPCCIEKPAPRAPSVLTGAANPIALPAATVVTLETALPAAPVVAPAPVPRARSAPLFLLLVTFLN